MAFGKRLMRAVSARIIDAGIDKSSLRAPARASLPCHEAALIEKTVPTLSPSRQLIQILYLIFNAPFDRLMRRHIADLLAAYRLQTSSS